MCNSIDKTLGIYAFDETDTTQHMYKDTKVKYKKVRYDEVNAKVYSIISIEI